jgi:hypothetical protein
MGLTITPAVGGRRTFLASAAAFVGASFVGAFAVISSAAVASAAVTDVFGRDAVIALVTVLVVLGVSRDCGLAAPVPYRSRQVPEGWRCRMSLPRVAGSYGALLGAAFFTRYTTSAQLTLYAVLAASFSLDRVAIALMMFVIGKALVLTVNARAMTMAQVVSSMERALKAPHQSLVRAVAVVCTLVLLLVFGTCGGPLS